MEKSWKKYVYLFTPLAVGGIVIPFIAKHIDYTSLIKPPFAPPKMIFPIAWTLLYLLMGISYKRLKSHEKFNLTLETVVYYGQLIINAFWPIIFFTLKWRYLACFWIVFLDCLITYMIVLFYKKDKNCAYLNIPYFIWSLFATYLTIGIYTLN